MLDLPIGAASDVDVAEGVAGRDDGVDLLLQPALGQMNVDEARPSNLDAPDQPVDRDVRGDYFGNRARVARRAGFAQRRRRDHRHVGTVVTVAGLLGAQHFDGRLLDRRQLPAGLRCGQRGFDHLSDLIPDHIASVHVASVRSRQLGPTSTSTLSGTASW